MFSLTDTNRFFLYPHPTDMRKSFYTLSGIVTNQMGLDVQDGDAFIFVNKMCTSMKVLHVERGFIHLPDMSSWEEEQSIPTAWSDLVMMVEDICPDTCRRAKRWSPKSGSQ